MSLSGDTEAESSMECTSSHSRVKGSVQEVRARYGGSQKGRGRPSAGRRDVSLALASLSFSESGCVGGGWGWGHSDSEFRFVSVLEKWGRSHWGAGVGRGL